MQFVAYDCSGNPEIIFADAKLVQVEPAAPCAIPGTIVSKQGSFQVGVCRRGRPIEVKNSNVRQKCTDPSQVVLPAF